MASVTKREHGVSGLSQFNGIVYEEFQRELGGSNLYAMPNGQKAAQVYKEMWYNSPVLNAGIKAITYLIRQVEWFFDMEEGQTDDRVDFLEECRHDMSQPWADVIAEIAVGMTVFGWSYHEEVYKWRQGPNALHPGKGSDFNDGRLGWRKLAGRAQDTLYRWEFDEKDGGLNGMWQQAPPKFDRVFMPITNSLLFRVETHKNNPEGLSMLRGAWQPYYYWKRLSELEAIGVERDFNGVPVMKAPASVAASDAQGGDAAQGTALRKMLRLLKNNRQTGLLLPSERDDNGELLYELSLLSNEGRKNHDSNAIIQRYLMLQAMALLADFLVLGHEENGARSVADNKTNFFALGLGALLDSVCAVFNRHAIPRLLHLNGLPLEEMPKLKHSDIQTSGMETFTKAIQQAVGAGLLTITEDDETYVREELGLPAITEERRQQVKDEAQAEFEREHEAQMELKDADRQENVEDA